MNTHMHMPAWMHWHKPNWHTMGFRLGHLVHDPRFWATVALAVLLTLMILTAIFTESQSTTPVPRPYPIYPYAP